MKNQPKLVFFIPDDVVVLVSEGFYYHHDRAQSEWAEVLVTSAAVAPVAVPCKPQLNANRIVDNNIFCF